MAHPMLQPLTTDTSLLPPTPTSDISWDQQRSPYSADPIDAIGWGYYTLPPSPPASVSSNRTDSPVPSLKMLASRVSPDSLSEGEPQHCLSTRQVFDLGECVDIPSSSSSSSTPPPLSCQLSLSADSGEHPAKRPITSTIGGVKKPRGSGERITTKYFVPPDVTGLTKREARLVKNRAAAFLSRQRKREEFEAMEIRVKELEEENSRLLTIAKKGNRYDELLCEMEHLRLRLMASEKRERELAMELASNSAHNQPVKTESHDHIFPPASYPPFAPLGQNTAASVGLMKQALLSVLPSLLSLPPQSPLPVTISVPLPSSSATRTSTPPFGHPSISTDAKEQQRQQFAHGCVGFNSSSADFDSLRALAIGADPSEGHRMDAETLRTLGNLAISFEPSPIEECRLRVRVHFSECPDKVALSSMDENRPRTSSLASWAGPDTVFPLQPFASAPHSAPVAPSPPCNLDTFMGNSHTKLSFDAQVMPSACPPFGHHPSAQAFEYYPGFLEQIPEDAAKHCARAAWKGMPQINTQCDWDISVS
ncbi:hypothetical protein PAXINDRAFT_99404 [Paxillus involutus ATCC 200175]|uniref:BZIP domain-containing protein n=1 Tax=Paxillus involutus ATCC 200175 TaxID=664439 RepID=A0A0C9U923_PAXIN|nr:hypothetical protein PAXINDRAFT_99404 [Paxillus involutus ATCC 200175]